MSPQDQYSVILSEAQNNLSHGLSKLFVIVLMLYKFLFTLSQTEVDSVCSRVTANILYIVKCSCYFSTHLYFSFSVLVLFPMYGECKFSPKSNP